MVIGKVTWESIYPKEITDLGQLRPNGIRVQILTSHLRLVYLQFWILLCIITHLLMSLSYDWLIFLAHDYFSPLNSLGILIYLMFLSDEGPTLETLDFTTRFGSASTFLYFDLYLYTACAAHNVISTFCQSFYILICI